LTRGFTCIAAIVVLALWACHTAGLAEETPVQRVLDVQGRLADPDTGKPFPDGPHQLVFQIYNAPEGGIALWFEVQDVVMKGGVFDTRLGEDPENPLTLPFDTQYWLAITYDYGGEMKPRIKLTCSPYSFYALNSDAVGGLHATASPAANCLLALDAGGKFPASVWDAPLELECYTSEQPSWTLRAVNTGYGDGLRGDSTWVGVRGVSAESAGVMGESESGTGGLFTSGTGLALEALGPTNLEGRTTIDGVVTVDWMCETPFIVHDWSLFQGYAGFQDGHGPHTNLQVDSYGGYDALTVSGDSALNGDLAASGTATVGNGIAVTGESTIDNVVWIARDSYTNFLVQGWSRFAGDLNVDNSFVTNGNAYIMGDLEVLGNKNAVVPTSRGAKKVYAQESPESWFEDFGSGKLEAGECTVELDPLFLETVTVDSDHPILVFITPTEPMGNFHVRKDDDSFTVVAEGRGSLATFDWRVVAKRRGYEDARLEAATGPRLRD
jgi:hypothetical protein